MKNKVVLSLTTVLLLVMIYSLTAVINNYNSQTPNDLLVFQRIIQKGQKTTEEIVNKPVYDFEYADIVDVEVNEDNTIKVTLRNKKVYNMTMQEIMNLTQKNYFNKYIFDQLNNRVRKYKAIKQELTEVTFSDYQDYLKMYPDMADAAVYSALDKTTVKDVDVMPVLVNENYLEHIGVKIEGDGITKDMLDKGLRKAVITKSFAEEKFYGETYIGKTFKLDGVRYQISGIIDDKTDLLNSFFKDGTEKIYIPYTAYKKYADLKLDYVSAVKGTKCERLLRKADFLNMERLDFTIKNPSVKAFGSAALIMMGIVISVCLFKLWLLSVKGLRNFVRKNMDKYYTGGMLKHKFFGLLFRILAVIVLPASILGVVYISVYDFQIVRYYIDNENLFSLSTALNTLSDVLGRETTFAYSGNTYNINMYNTSLIFEFILTLLICPLIGFWLYSFDVAGKTNRGFSQVMIWVVFTMAFFSFIVWANNDRSNVFFISTVFMTVIMMIKNNKKICK